MKNILLAIIFVLSILTACKKNIDTSYSDGIITGFDARMCMCCGGYFIKIDTLQYRFYENPDTNIIKTNGAIFPIFVRLKWKLKDNACMPDLIDVLQMEKR